jgi:hypothetical protein
MKTLILVILSLVTLVGFAAKRQERWIKINPNSVVVPDDDTKDIIPPRIDGLTSALSPYSRKSYF